MAMVDREAVAAIAVTIYDAISRYPLKEAQLVGLAAAFMMMARATGVPPQDIFNISNNLIYDKLHSERIKAQFAGLLSYLQEDVLN